MIIKKVIVQSQHLADVSDQGLLLSVWRLVIESTTVVDFPHELAETLGDCTA